MRSLKRANILITGGAGFIGSNLAQVLVQRGARVTIVDLLLRPYGGNMYNLASIKKQIHFIHGDIRSKQTIQDAVKGKDIIFHLAAQTGRVISMTNPFLDTSINVTGTLLLLDEVKRLKKKPKVIFSSSRGVIGEPQFSPVNEEHPTAPRDIYGINKLAAEQYCLLYGKAYSFAVTVLRLNNIYGPRCQMRSNHYGTINLFIAAALQGKRFTIYGDGSQTRDYVYIDDTVDALIRAIDPKADGRLFFVGSGRSCSLTKIARIIVQTIPGASYRFAPLPDELKNIDFHDFRSDPREIKRILGWKANTNINEGIHKTIRFYQKNLRYYL